jgi:multisubunit Na+/H+ antiporter MnhE subunit
MFNTIISNTHSYINEQIKELTIYHIISAFIISTITAYILRNKLIKWIYVGTWTVFIINAFNTGNELEAGKDIYKIARV